jgi:hypothetical protein
VIALAQRGQEMARAGASSQSELLSIGIGALLLIACLLLIWRALLGAPRLVRGNHEGRCLEEGCDGILFPVRSRRGRILYCPHGHCWVERKRRLAVDVYRYSAGDCPYDHAHHPGCAHDLVEDHG